MIVTSEGLRCLVETDQVAQMQASLSRDLFDAFLWSPQDAEFGAPVGFDMDLGLLLDALTVFQGTPEMDVSSMLTLSMTIPLDGSQIALSYGSYFTRSPVLIHCTRKQHSR